MNEEILNSIVEDRIDDIISLIKQVMKNHRITQRELAIRINVSISAVSMWLNKTNNISLEMFLKICTVLGLPDIEKYLMKEVIKDATKQILKKSQEEFNNMVNQLLGEYNG